MWENIKRILRKNQGACIIIEDGKPIFVVTKFEEYEKLLDSQSSSFLPDGAGTNEQELLEKINQEINNWKAKQAETSVAAEEVGISEEEDVKIENLPIV